jgi:hypothetical protein
MHTSSRPDSPVDRAAARRNYLIFSVAAVIVMSLIVTVITLIIV